MTPTSNASVVAVFVVSGLFAAACRLSIAAIQPDPAPIRAAETTVDAARTRMTQERASRDRWEDSVRRGRAAAVVTTGSDAKETSSSGRASVDAEPPMPGPAVTTPRSTRDCPDPVAVGDVVITRVVGASAVLPGSSTGLESDTILEPKLEALRRFGDVNRAVGKHGEPAPFQSLCLARNEGFHVIVGMESFDGDLTREGLLRLVASLAGRAAPDADSSEAGLVLGAWSEVRARRAELRCAAWNEMQRLVRDGVAKRIDASSVTALFAARGRIWEWRRGDDPALDLAVDSLKALEVEIAATVRRTVLDK